jgi:biotin/methionine sulfoxide reductase
LDHGEVSQDSKIAGREPVWIHPDDAVRRGIETGDVVCLFNLRGACLAGAMVTPAVRAGVVQLATGAWFDPEEPGVPGSLERQGNPNVLTRDTGTSRLAQGPTAQSCLVEITKSGRRDLKPLPCRRRPVLAMSGPLQGSVAAGCTVFMPEGGQSPAGESTLAEP